MPETWHGTGVGKSNGGGTVLTAGIIQDGVEKMKTAVNMTKKRNRS